MSEIHYATDTTPKARRAFKIALLVTALVLLNYGAGWFVRQINFQFWPRHEQAAHLILLASIGLYVLLMTLPFMPGIEVGLALMLMLGPRGIGLVYLCTVASLSLSYLLGRLIPLAVLARFLGWLYLKKAERLLVTLQPLGAEERLELLLRHAPRKVVPFLLRHRYLVVAVALNIPGNALIGGGGGIGVIAGMSGLYSFPGYLLVVSVAITPVPLILLAKLAIAG